MNGERCELCRYYIDHRTPDDDPDEVNGYCCHPFHFTDQSPHAQYGGHWTHHELCCEMFTAGESVVQRTAPERVE